MLQSFKRGNAICTFAPSSACKADGKKACRTSLGDAMLWRVLVLFVVAAALFGCVTAREGVDFASLSQTAGAPKSKQGSIVVLREAGYGGLLDYGYAVTLDGERMGDLKTGTFLYLDRPAGSHQLSVDESGFPGVIRKDISVASGQTYFFLVQPSERSRQLQAGQVAGGLAGLAVTAIVTSQADNPGPVDFVSLDDAAGKTGDCGLTAYQVTCST